MAALSNLFETKVVILGATGVGKTSMVNQFVSGKFTSHTTTTIGAAFTKKEIVIGDWNVILQIWDTAGQERFRSMAPMYYRGASAAIVVFDISVQDTLDKVESWVEELRANASEDIAIVLAANKCDLRGPDGASSASIIQRAQQYAKSISATCFETSAKTGKGIPELFEQVATQLLKTEQARRAISGKTPSRDDGKGSSKTVRIEDPSNPFPSDKSNSGCCGGGGGGG